MISELKIRNFKSLESVDLKLGHFNLLVGANASGKSNFLDALRFLQGVGRGLGIGEILNGKPQLSETSRWDGIRGGSEFVTFRNRDGKESERVELEARISGGPRSLRDGADDLYRLSFSSRAGVVEIGDEFLTLGKNDDAVISSAKRTRLAEKWAVTAPNAAQKFSERTLLSDLAAQDANYERSIDSGKLSDGVSLNYSGVPMSHSPKAVLYISRLFADMQFLSLDPGALSAYSLTSPTPRMGEQGDGFAGLIKYLEGQASDLAALTEWLKELRPDEVESLYTVKAPAGEYMAAIKERGWEFLAPTLSEGTLRFIALAAAFFQPSMPKVLVIEEIEKGLHPSRLRLLLDLMRSQSKRTGTQVFATTHSPTLLAWLTEEDRKTTFVCTRDAESGATKMRSLAEIPRFEELIQEGSHIDELFAEGWLESAPQ
jgi:energy-coupling factor transporter ATP-binding protein EcfA2